MKHTRMDEVIMERFQLKKTSPSLGKYGEKDVRVIGSGAETVSRDAGGRHVADAVDGKDQATVFYGGLIGKTGAYSEKVFLLKQDEKVALGAAETDDIFIIGAMQKRTLCMISYDDALEEYHVQPLHKNAIFLENRQPLGKDRIYCIPRGKTLIIDSKKNMFTLA